jgi:DNA-binding transcriptional ArsR family regulator
VTNAGAEVGAVLAAMADPTRRQLLDALVEAGRASATTLADRLPVSRQAVVKHLRILETAGLVEWVRAGREVLYSARPEPLDASARWLADLSARWDRRLNTLKRAAESGVRLASELPPQSGKPSRSTGRNPS